MLDRLLYPLLVFGFIGATWLLMGETPREVWELIPGVLSLPLLVLMEILERQRPARPEWRRNYGDAVADMLHTLVLFPVVLKFSQLAAAALSGRFHGFGGFDVLPPTWPLWLQFIVALLAAELFFYGIHRLAHTVGPLWRFHRIHHGAHRVYYANAGRFHPVDLWLTMTVYFVPLYLFSVPLEVIVLFLAANVSTGLLEHANIRFEAGWLNYVFNSAQLHRWHHSRVLGEANRNFGKVLSVWDWVFGTFRLAPGRQVGTVGLAEGEPEVPQTIWKQGLAPFLSRRVIR